MDEDATQKTRATYDAIAKEWTASYEQQKPFWEPEMKALQAALPHGHILEIGAGGGRDAELFATAGYDYTGVDSSAGMVKLAQKSHPSLRFLLRDVCNLGLPKDTQFDGFWAAAVLLHLPSAKVDTALRQIHSVIRPGGFGMITMRQGSGEGLRERIKHGLSDKRYFTHYTAPEFCKILERNGFDVVKVDNRPEGDEYIWLSFLVRVVK